MFWCGKILVLLFFGGWTKESMLKSSLLYFFSELPQRMKDILGSLFLSEIVLTIVIYVLGLLLINCFGLLKKT